MTGQWQDRVRAFTRLSSEALRWLVYSNLFSSVFSIGGMTAAMMVLLRVPVDPVLLFIAFSGSMFIYSLNRVTDREEDRMSLPDRSEFSGKYGGYFTAISIPLFGVSLVLAALQGTVVLAVVLMPLAIGILYSILRMKRVPLLKNLAVSLGVSATLLMVVAVSEPPHATWFPLYGILVIGVIVNTVIFDIKDIAGDSSVGIRTLPVLLGSRVTRKICGLLLGVMALLAIPLVQRDGIFLALVPYILYKSFYVLSIPRDETPWWYYGLVVDGEFIPLLIFSLLLR